MYTLFTYIHYTHASICIRVYRHKHVYAYMYTYIHTYIHACMHACTHARLSHYYAFGLLLKWVEARGQAAEFSSQVSFRAWALPWSRQGSFKGTIGLSKGIYMVFNIWSIVYGVWYGLRLLYRDLWYILYGRWSMVCCIV